MSWQSQLTGDSISWLLEEDDPGIRYLTMRDLLDLAPDDKNLAAARTKAHQEGPIAAVLKEMHKEGFWEKEGPGYTPKYRSTVWSIILLDQLGASIGEDPRIEKACRYLLEQALTEYGQFSTSGSPGGTVDCLQGNLCTALLDLGMEPAVLDSAFDWMARSLTGDGVAPMGDKSTPIRYYSGKIGSGFLCGANNKLACAWGAVKVMLAFSKLPKDRWKPLIEKAVKQGVDFLFSVDPVDATYPSGWAEKPSGNWWKFGFPVFYVTDLLQNVEALVRLGYGKDPRLAKAIDYIREKQDADGRWSLDYHYIGKTWVDFGEKKQPNKWVTYRAARVLKNSY